MCLRATKPGLPQLLGLRPTAGALQQEKPPQREARIPRMGSSPCLLRLKEDTRTNDGPAQPKIK